MLYRVYLAISGIRTHNFSSCKYNHHTITITTAPGRDCDNDKWGKDLEGDNDKWGKDLEGDNDKWGKDMEVLKTSDAYRWSFVTQIILNG
jgi:hypothetical protein